jgi:hypothetical protein
MTLRCVESKRSIPQANANPPTRGSATVGGCKFNDFWLQRFRRVASCQWEVLCLPVWPRAPLAVFISCSVAGCCVLAFIVSTQVSRASPAPCSSSVPADAAKRNKGPRLTISFTHPLPPVTRAFWFFATVASAANSSRPPLWPFVMLILEAARGIAQVIAAHGHRVGASF